MYNVPEPVGLSKGCAKGKVYSNKCLHSKTHDREKTASSTNVAGTTGYPHEED
jgi:hypothetical protein